MKAYSSLDESEVNHFIKVNLMNQSNSAEEYNEDVLPKTIDIKDSVKTMYNL